MPPNSADAREQLPRYESAGPARPPPSYGQDCQRRLKEIDALIDELGKKKDKQIEIAYDPARRDVLETARHTLKHWNRVLANIKRRPDESDRDHLRRLKQQEMTEEDYRRSMAT